MSLPSCDPEDPDCWINPILDTSMHLQKLSGHMQELSNVNSDGTKPEDLIDQIGLIFKDLGQSVQAIAKTVVNEKDRIHSQVFWDDISEHLGALSSLIGEISVGMKKKN